MNARRGLLLLAMASLLGGCGGKVVVAPPPPEPAAIQLQVAAGADVNPDRQGRPSPVVLRIFVLNDAVAFDKASLEQMSDNARDVLAGTMLGENRLLVRPGEQQTLTLEVPPAARYLVATAEFADALGSTWRAKLPIDAAAVPSGGFTLAVERNQIRLQPVAAAR